MRLVGVCPWTEDLNGPAEMGGCHSKKVVIPDIETSARCRSMLGSYQSDIQPQSKTSGNSADSEETVFSLEQLEHLEICLKEAEEKAKALLEQLTASEATKSQLLEKVSLLEGRLEDVNRKNVGGELYENMVLEKDKCIEKLQAEVKASQEKLNAHKLKHRKAVKKLQTDLAIAKQEAAITVLELNEKIMTLCEGRPFPRASNSVEVLYGGLPPVEESDRKVTLIMELSTQLSLQTEKITQLEDVLAEKEKKIEELEAERTSQFPQDEDRLTEDLQESPTVYDEDRTVPAASDEECEDFPCDNKV
ncbi:LOW QUALITY PROTEIN: coiled-coil domain-containing protein 192 [Mastomys coucha]|uniref:LOW QUALITY PROTEIN: coiled-coil domain-containing protein 192 n=1 Tax=Mastomys coucha TaxID=35658 RepID=UPI0012613CA6|nr:LOW QUALITY PROTEIN: coiled-coil domain-containing protein 192 [Mastomys coucha]